jgi:hypothetical protein
MNFSKDTEEEGMGVQISEWQEAGFRDTLVRFTGGRLLAQERRQSQ